MQYKGEIKIVTAEIIFWINSGLAFCTLIDIVALVVLCRKTVYKYGFGYTAVMLGVYGLIAYVVQLAMYSAHSYYKDYSVYAAFYIFCMTAIAACLYFFLLCTRSNKQLCIATGILTFVPPLGAILAVVLSYRVRRDTYAQELVFNGYAYTIAALKAFASRNGARFIDGAGEENFERLTAKAARAHLKKLKKQAVTPEGMYNYAAAIAFYAPQNMRDAVGLMVKAAKGGYAAALFNLGYYFETGNYVKKDVKKAREYYKRAADAGDGDAALRSGILAAESGSRQEGFDTFTKLASRGDRYAEYNIAVCYEQGIGTDKNEDKAIEIYTRCACRGLPAAQDRVFAMASECIHSQEKSKQLRKLTDINALGDFGMMINGLKEIAKKNAPAAAEYFLKAVKCRARWEGTARCFVGTLYMDSGKLLNDKRNGAAYVKSALSMTPIAKEIYATVPKEYINVKRGREKNSR